MFCSAGGRAAAQVRRGAVEFVAERLAGKRVVGERHGKVSELRRKRAVVFGGIEAKGLDVSQQCDSLVESRLSRANARRRRGREHRQTVPASWAKFDLSSQRLRTARRAS